MTDRIKPVWTEEKVRALGVRTDVPTAGEIIAGLCRDESYRMVKRGDGQTPRGLEVGWWASREQ